MFEVWLKRVPSARCLSDSRGRRERGVAGAGARDRAAGRTVFAEDPFQEFSSRRGPRPGAGSGSYITQIRSQLIESQRRRVPASELPGPGVGPGWSGSGCLGEAPSRGAALCTPSVPRQPPRRSGVPSMPAPGGPSGTSDEAWVPHRCRGWGGQRQLARAGPANWDAQVWDVAPGAVPGSGVSLWKGPWGRREAGNPPLKTSTVSHMSPEWRARVLEEDGVLPPDHRGPRGQLRLVFAFPVRAPCKRVSLYFSVPSHPEKGWRQPCRVHLCCDLPSPPSTVPALSTPWDLCQLSHSPSVAGQGGLAGQCCRLPALPPFPAHVGSRLGGVRVLLGCV